MIEQTPQFRNAREADLPFLIRLRSDTMREHVENSGIAYDEEKQLQRVMDRFDCAQIIMHEGWDIGLLKLDRNVVPWMFMQIQISPEHQKRGIGEEILRRILAEAQGAHTAVTLKVLKANPARRLYERVGFHQIGENDQSFFMQCP